MTQLLSSPPSNNKPFAHVTYVTSDTRLGQRRVKVGLEAHFDHLLVRDRGNEQGLLAIPWPNIREIRACLVEKSYMGKALSDVLGPIPVLQLMKASSDVEFGMTITFWDARVQREQFPTFAVGDDIKRFNRLQQAIFQYRDYFMGIVDDLGDINRR